MKAERELRARRGGTITPVEAFVLAVMLAIVVAIAVPSYISLRDRASDSAARAHVREAVGAVQDYRAGRGSYAGLSVAALKRVAPGLETSGLRLERARGTVCVQATAGGRAWHADGSVGTLSSGTCP